MRLSLNTVLFNVAGIGVLLFVGVYMVNSFFHTEVISACHTRYGNGMRFPLSDNNGRKLTSLEFQARLPGREWGLLKNLRVVESQDRKAQYLQVALGSMAEDDEGESSESRDGVGFVWMPNRISGADAACLKYKVFFSKDFSFDVSGKLPGLYATRELEDIDAQSPQSGFVSRLAWQKRGGIGVTLRTADAPESWLGTRKDGWPVGRWVDVEQEVVLNAAGKSNGLIRVWIDGQLRIEKTGIALRRDNQNGLSGVVADLGYDQVTSYRGRLTISPFVIQRQ